MAPTSNISIMSPWQRISAQDIEKISPTAMRENNADYFLHELYRTAREIVIYNYHGSITPDTSISFGWGIKSRFGQEHRYFYTYQQNTVYLRNTFEMLPLMHLPVAHFTPEQDTVFRHAVESVIEHYKPWNLFKSTSINKIKITTPTKFNHLIQYFGTSLQIYQEQNPLQTPVRCNGCNLHCYFGYQKHPQNPYAPHSIYYDECPTINHILAKDCPDKCATKLQEYINHITNTPPDQNTRKTFTQAQRTNITPEQGNVYVSSPGKCNGCDAGCELGTAYALNNKFVYPTIDGRIIARYIDEKHYYQYPGTSTFGWESSPEYLVDIIAQKVGIIARLCDHYKTK